MKRLFAIHGIPEIVLTDNGRQFASREFQQNVEDWNFAHLPNNPYYVQSNGLVENTLKQAKLLLENCKRDVSNFLLGLLSLQNTPKDDAMGCPAHRLLSDSRAPRC